MFTEGGGKFSYEVGATYTYEYRVNSVTSVASSSSSSRNVPPGQHDHEGEEQARLHVSASVDITALSACEFSLQVKEVMLEESAPQDAWQRTPSTRHREFSEGVSARPLRFSFQDGRVAQICPSSLDAPWVINFKRGLLSAFQNSMPHLEDQPVLTVTETDVSGICETQYHVAGWNDSTVVVRRDKNLRSCSNRVEHFLSLPSASYSAPAKSLPLIRSKQSCSQTVKEGLLVEVSCQESHLFRPFSNGDNGAVTRVTQALVLSDVTRQDRPYQTVESPVRASLLFHHQAQTVGPTAGQTSLHDAMSALEHLAKLSTDGVKLDAPRAFAGLVRSLRAMDYSQLSRLFGLARESRLRLLLDAMPLVSTADGVQLLVELLSARHISAAEGDSWLQSITFHSMPTVDMLQALQPLLEGQPRPEFMLGVSALVHGYCTANPDCQDVQPVRAIMSRLEALLGHDCRTTTFQDEHLVLHALKSIGNAGVLVASPHTLRRCYQRNNSIEVRLAAISAHRRLMCEDSTSAHLLYTYSDMGEDSEVRIAAYLAAMRCPTEETLQRIKDVLYSEDVSQVASFVWTHLTNLQETSSPGKQGIKQLIANNFLQNKFSTDARKFSRNYEASAFSEVLNLGGTLDGNLVFSPESYLPRSASLNLTVDLFGEAINLVELGGRAEGFENYVESIFAPDGFFPEKSLKSMLEKLRKDSKKAEQHTSDSIDNKHGKDFEAPKRIPKPPTASLYTRIFGNELKFSHFNGLEDIVESLGKLKDAKELLSKILKEKHLHYTKSVLLVDAWYVIPTTVGFPLEFTVNGSATIDLKMSGHMDVDGAWSRGVAELKGEVRPSVAVEFCGTMMVDAFTNRAGLLSVSRLHSSTLVDGKLKVQGGRLLEAKLNVPRDRLEVLKVTSQLLLVRGDQGAQGGQQEVRGVRTHQEGGTWCTSDSVGKLVGMRACTVLSYCNATSIPFSPYFPLTGPFTFHIWLEKTDSFSSYDLSYRSSDEQHESVYQLSADTPGSKVDRKFKFLYILNTRDKLAKLDLVVPGFKLASSAKLENSARHKGFHISVVVNDDKVLESIGSVRMSRADQQHRYLSSLSLTVMNREVLGVAGRAHLVAGPKFSGDLVVTCIYAEPVLISGDVVVDETGLSAQTSLNCSLLDGSLHASLRRSRDDVTVQAGVSYTFPDTVERAVTFSAKTSATDDGPFGTRSASVSLHWTNLAVRDVDAWFNWQLNASREEASAMLSVGELYLQAEYTDSSQLHPDHTRRLRALHLKCPHFNLDTNMHMVSLVGQQGRPSSHRMQVEVSGDTKLDVLYTWNQPSPGKADISLAASLPWIMLSTRGTVSLRQSWQVECSLHAVLTDSQGLNSIHEDHGQGQGELRASAGLVWTDGHLEHFAELRVGRHAYHANVSYTNHRSQKLMGMVRLGEQRWYGGTLEWMVEPQVKELALELQLEKKFSLASEVKNSPQEKGVEVVVFWDKDGDASKTASLLMSATAEKAQVSLVLQKQYVSAEVNFTSNCTEGQLQWTGGSKVHGQLLMDAAHLQFQLTTPFPGFHMQSVILHYHRNNFTGEVVWQDKNIEFSVGTDYTGSFRDDIQVDIDVQFASSFPALRTAAARFSHAQHHKHQKSMKTSLSLDLDNQHAEFTSFWSMSSSELEGSMSFESPWKCAESALYKMKLVNSNILSLVFIDLRWNDDVDMTVDYSYDTKLRTHTVAKFRKPLMGYKQLSAELLLSAENSVFMLKTHMTILPFEASLEISRQSRESLRMSGVLSTTTLGKWEVEIVNEAHLNSKFTKSVDIKKESRSISRLDIYGKIVSLFEDSEIHVSATTSQNVFTGSLASHIESSCSKSTFQAKWNGAKLEAEINGIFAQEASKISNKYDAVFSSTFFKQDWKVMLSHISEPGNHVVLVEAPELISINYTLVSKIALNWDMMLQLNSSRVNFSVVQRLAYVPREDFVIDFVADWNNQKLVANYHYNVGVDKQGLAANLATPWTNPVRLELNLALVDSALKPSFALVYGEGKKVTLAGILRLTILQSLVQFHLESPFTSPLFLNASYSVEKGTALAVVQWGKAVMEARVDVRVLGTSANCSVLVLTPVSSWQSMALAASYDKSEAGATARLSVSRDSDAVVVSGLVGVAPENLRLRVELTSPFVKFKTISLDCKCDGNDLDVTYEHDGSSVELNGKYRWHGSSNGSVELRLKTSSELLDDLGVLMWYDLENIAAGFIAHKNLKKVQALLNSNERRTEIQLMSPFKIMEESSMSIRHVYIPDEKFTVNVVLNYNGNTVYAAGYVCKSDNDSVTASLEVRTPFKDFNKLRLDYSFAGLVENQKKSSITLSKNDQRFDITATLSSIDEQQKYLILKIDMPLKGYESIVSGLSYNINRMETSNSEFTTEGRLHTFLDVVGNKKEITVNFMVGSTAASVNVTTNFESIQFASLATSFQVACGKMFAHFRATCNSHTLSGNVSSELGLFKSDSQVHVMTSLPSLQEIMFHLGYDLLGKEKTAYAHVQFNEINYMNAHALVFMGNECGHVTAMVDVPISLVKLVSVSGSYDLSPRKNKELNFTLSIDRYEFRIRATNSRYKTTLKLSTPFDILQRIDLTCNHKLDLPGVVSLTLEKEDSNVLFDTSLHVTQRKVILKLNLPFRQYHKFHVISELEFMTGKEPGFSLSLVTLKNTEKLLDTKIIIILDWANKIGINIMRQFPNYKQMSISAWSSPEFPPAFFQLTTTREGTTLGSFESILEDVRDGGFTFRSKYSSANVSRNVVLQYYPEDLLINFSSDMGVLFDKAISVQGELSYDERGQSLNMMSKLVTDGIEKTFQLSCNFDKHQIFVELKTPIHSFENITVDGYLNLEGNKSKLLNISAYKNDHRLNMNVCYDFNIDHSKVFIFVQVPFIYRDKLSLDFQHNFQDTKKSASVELAAGSQLFSASGSLSVGYMLAEIDIKMSTPLSYLQTVGLLGKYDFSPATMKKFELASKVNGIKCVKVAFELDYTASAGSIMLYVNGPEEFSARGNYNFSREVEDYVIRSCVILSSEDVLRLSAQVRRNMTHGRVTAQVLGKESQIQWDYNNTPSNKKVSSRLMFGKNCTCSFEVMLKQYEASKVEVSVGMNLLYSQNYVAHARWDISNAVKPKGTLDLKMPNNQHIYIESSLQLGSIDDPIIFTLAGNGSLKTSGEFRHETKITLGDSFTLESALDSNEQNVFFVNFSSACGHLRSYIACTLQWSDVPPLFGRLGYNLADDEKIISGELEFGTLKILLVGSASIAAAADFKVNVEIKALDTDVQKLHLHSIMNLSDSGKNVETSLEYSNQTWKLCFVQNGRQDFSLVLHTPIARLEMFKFAAGVSTVPQEPAHLELIIGRLLAATATCLRSQNGVRFGVHVKLDSREPVDIEGLLTTGDVFHSLLLLTLNKKEISLNFYADTKKQKNVISVEGVLKCPWMEDVTVVGHYKNDDERESQIIVTKGSKISSAKGSLKYLTTSNGYNVMLTMFLDDFTTTIMAEIEMGENVSFLLSSKMDLYSFNFRISRSNNKVVGRVHVRTPHTSLEEVDGSVEMFLGTAEEPQAHLVSTLRLDDREYSLSSNAIYSASYVSANLTLLTPGLKFENNTFFIAFDENVVALEYQVYDLRLITRLSHQLSWPEYSVNLTLDLPYYDVHQLTLSSYLYAENPSFLVSGEIQSSKIFSFIVQMIPDDFLLKLNTRLHVIPNVSITSKLKKDEAITHQLYSTLKWKAEQISLEATSRIHSKNSAVRTIISWSNNNKLDFSASYVVTGGNITETIAAAFLVSTPASETSSRLEIDLRTPNTTIANFVAVTPFEYVSDLRAITNFHMSSNSLKGYVSLTSRNKTLSIRSDVIHTNVEFISLRAEIDIPVEDIPPVELTIQMQQSQWRNFSTYVHVLCLNAEVQANISYMLQQSSLNVNGIILLDTTLFAEEISFGGSFQHDALENVHITGHVNTNEVTLHYTSNQGKEKSLDCKLQIPLLNLKDYKLSVKLEDGLNKHVSVAYKTDDHESVVSLAVQMIPRNISLEVIVHAPILCSSRHVARMGFESAASRQLVQLYYEHGDLTDTASLMFSNDRDFKLSGYIQSSSRGDKEVQLVVGKQLDKFSIDLWKTFQVSFKWDSKSGSIYMNIYGQKHSLSYYVQIDDNFKGSVYVESPYIINKKLSISAMSDTNQGSSITETNVNSGDVNYKAIVHFTPTANTKDTSVTVSLNSRPVITSNIRMESSVQQVLVDASLEVFGTVHKASIRHNKLLMFDSEFKISSNYLPDGMVTGLLNVQNCSIISYIGYGSEKFVPVVAVEAAVDKQNGSAFLNVESRMLSIFHMLQVHGAYKLSNWQNINANFHVQYLSEMFPTARATGLLAINGESIDVSISAQSSFVGFDHLGCDIHIPIAIGFDMNPRGMITLPAGQKYGLNLTVRFLSDEMELGLSGNIGTDEAGIRFITVYGSQGKLQLEMDMPFLKLNHFRLDLMGYRTLSDGGDTSNLVEWNDNQVELRHAMLLEADKAIFHVELLTPFENHGRYDAVLRYENKQSKVASVLFTLPLVGENIGISFDLMFHNILDFCFLGEVNLPITDRFETASFSVKNNIGGHEVNSSIAARYNEEEFAASITSSFSKKQIEVDISGHINQYNISLHMDAGQKYNVTKQVSVKLSTPFAILRQFGADFTAPSSLVDGMTTNVTYNHEQMLEIVIEKNMKSVRSLMVHTPWRSVAGILSCTFEGELMVSGELCWDVGKSDNSLVGLKVNVRPHPENRLEMSTELKIPTRTVSLDVTYQTNPNTVEYMSKFSWRQSHGVGYHLLLDSKKNGDNKQTVFLLRGDLPFRSFEINGQSRLNSTTSDHLSVEVLWDALGNRTKKMQVSIDTSARHTEVLFHHPGLQSNWVLRVMNNKNLRCELEYSPIKENMFVVEMFVQFSPIVSLGTLPNIDAMFLVQHNASRLNLHICTKVSFAETEVNGALSIRYDDFRREGMQVLHLEGVANHAVPTAEFVMRTTRNHISAGASTFTGLDGSHGLRLKTSVNEKRPLSLEVRLNVVHPLLELEVRCGSNRTYNAYVGLSNRRQMLLGARHALDGVQTVDGLVMVSLNTSRLLWTKLQWRTDSLKEARAFMRHEYGDIPAIVSSVTHSFTDLFQEDFAGRFAVTFAPLQQAYADLQASLITEVHHTCADVTAAVHELTAMYCRDDFYLMSVFTFVADKVCSLAKSIQLADHLPTAARSLWNTLVAEPFMVAVEMASWVPATIQATLEEAKVLYTACNPREALRKALEGTRRALLQAESVLQELLDDLDACVVTMAAEHARLTEPFVAALEDASSHLRRLVERLCLRLQGSLDSLLQQRQSQWLVHMYHKYASWLEELHLQGHLGMLQQRAFNSSQAVLSHVDAVLGGYRQQLVSALDQLTYVPEVQLIANITSFMVQKARWAWGYYEAGDLLRAGLGHAAGNLSMLLADLVMALGEGSTSWSVPRSADGGWSWSWSAGTLVVRPGLVEFAQQLPVDWLGFDEAPRFQQLTLCPSTRSQRFIQDPGRFSTDITIPTNTTALLVRGRRFVTFDGKFFDFLGNCSYLLAADLDSRYYIFITYHGEKGGAVSKSLTLVVGDRRVQLAQDGQVQVQGRHADFPATVGSPEQQVQLWRSGDTVVVAAPMQGMRLQCDLVGDVCSLQVNHQVGGLLATLRGDVRQHASRWRAHLHPGCGRSGPEQSRPPTADPDLAGPCRSLFLSSKSPLGACHGVVPPTPYLAMCLADAREGPCTSAAAYEARCRASGVAVGPLAECVRCLLEDGTTMRQGEARQLGPGRPEAADVVLVVERAACLAQLDLRELTEKLYAGMAMRGLQQVRYSMVSFGHGQPAQTHTAHGEVWLSHRGVRSVLRSLVYGNSSVGGSEGSDAVEAVQYAAGLRFREGASRTVVLVQCEPCHAHRGYEQLMSVLVSQGAALHVLEPRTIRLASPSSSKAAKVYGLDALGAYTARNVGTGKPSILLRRQVRLPKDQCTPAALETGGTLFDLAHLLRDERHRLRANSAKKFLDVWAKRLSAAALPAACQRCECHAGRTWCTECEQPGTPARL